jgi:hypothetical protein
MLRKIHIAAIVFLILPLFLLFGITNGFGLGNNEIDSSSMVCFTPDNIAGVHVGETVTVSVILSEDVVNLYAFDIELNWDPATLEYVSHVVMAPVESYSQGVLHDPTFSLKDEVNSSAGTCWIACSSMPPAESFSGNGVLFTITFKVLSTSNETPLQLVNVALSDDAGQPIVHQSSESAVETPNEPYRPPLAQKLRHASSDKLWWDNQIVEMQAHCRDSEHAWHP